MLDICFLITTYNRKESCQRLADSLQGLGDIIVAHDGTNYNINGATNLNPQVHLGKAGYWRLINMLWRERPIHQYYMMLPDDFMICDSRIAKAIETWGEIKDPRKICLNLYMDRLGQSCWTKFMPVDKGNLWQTGWIDMCFLCENKFFAEVGELPQLNHGKTHKFNGSSGVGAFISRKLLKKHLNIYQVKESLVDLQKEHYSSQMHR